MKRADRGENRSGDSLRALPRNRLFRMMFRGLAATLLAPFLMLPAGCSTLDAVWKTAAGPEPAPANSTVQNSAIEAGEIYRMGDRLCVAFDAAPPKASAAERSELTRRIHGEVALPASLVNARYGIGKGCREIVSSPAKPPTIAFVNFSHWRRFQQELGEALFQPYGGGARCIAVPGRAQFFIGCRSASGAISWREAREGDLNLARVSAERAAQLVTSKLRGLSRMSDLIFVQACERLKAGGEDGCFAIISLLGADLVPLRAYLSPEGERRNPPSPRMPVISPELWPGLISPGTTHPTQTLTFSSICGEGQSCRYQVFPDWRRPGSE